MLRNPADKSKAYYEDYRSRARRWVKAWGHLGCTEITKEHVRRLLLKRSKVSPFTANRDLRRLRTLFNTGIREEWVDCNPTLNIEYLADEEKFPYVPPLEDIFQVISQAGPDTQDYLWAIRETLARVGEINRLKWSDVNLESQDVTLYTRKKKGGHLTPRKVATTERLHRILSRRYEKRGKDMPWVFWHTHRSRKTGETQRGPYGRRKRLMKGLCSRAGVRYFTFHALRHSGATVMDQHGVPIGSIQRILGHNSRITTEKYLHALANPEREAVVIFESATKDSHTNSHTTGEDTEEGTG